MRNIVRTIPINPTFLTKVISRTIPADGEVMVEDDGRDEKLVPHVSTEFAAEVFDLNSIKKAAYRVCDIAAVDIEPQEDRILCTLRFHQPQKPSVAEQAVNDFKVEVLDQNLRSAIASETETVRNAILAYAFSKTHLQSVE